MIKTAFNFNESVCGDHSCVFGPVQGMGTNGGCRCPAWKLRYAITVLKKLARICICGKIRGTNSEECNLCENTLDEFVMHPLAR